MTDRIREQCKNRGDRYTREVADEQLKRIGLTLGPDFYPERKSDKGKAAEPNNLFLTGSGTNTPTKRGGKKTIRYKEHVQALLVGMGIPISIAELAVIDMKHTITLGYHNKDTAHATAQTMFDPIHKRYRHEDGRWHYLKYNSVV